VPEQEKEEQQPNPQSQRPTPVGKEVRATLDGKDVAFERLTRRVAQREGRHFQQRVALTDGAEALQDRMIELVPQFTLVLDIIHALEYLWLAANALLGETNPERTAWVRERLLHILSGQTSTVVQDLENQIRHAPLSPTQCEALKTTIGYYRRNSPYMCYDQYLNNGWPIGTGVVEGACGHLVKDRMEQSGMRWTKQGAQSLLDLRAVRINDDWDVYHRFHRNSNINDCMDRALSPYPHQNAGCWLKPPEHDCSHGFWSGSIGFVLSKRAEKPGFCPTDGMRFR
jgi:hypothetical protein